MIQEINEKRYLIWDFDGTLGYRVGGWSATLLSVLHQYIPEYIATTEQIRPYLQIGFPWHTPDQPHLHIKSAEMWWQALAQVFYAAFVGVGIMPAQALELAHHVRAAYIDPIHWQLYDDTLLSLKRLSTQGWTHIILSNHVPELPEIVHSLGLGSLIARIFNSADTGYEKPHPQAYWNVIAAFGETSPKWMIGDSPQADIAGAEAVGIPAILVRKPSEGMKFNCGDLREVEEVLTSFIKRG